MNTNVKNPNIFVRLMISFFGEYGFDVLYPPDLKGDYEYHHYYILFGKKTYLGYEWGETN
jgi:hypothetical protein